MPFILEGGATDQDGIGFLKPEARGDVLSFLLNSVLSARAIAPGLGMSRSSGEDHARPTL